ncbi:MAG TPA: HEAT repeat domain-containing protein, partial [Acidimicrobiales bacterium]|nr:HEAT repeat domain-containing protein [Acidimicrobiales bacterium]
MSDLLAGIRDRRQATTSQALGLLAGVPAADLETRRSLLSMAGRYLADPDVLARWVELASVEADPDLKAQMVQRVANADQRQLQDVASYIDLMVTGLASSRLRTLAVNALNRLVVGFPQAVDALREAYAGQPSDAARERILVALCQVHRPNGPLTQFLAAEADRCRAATRALVVDRLLRTGSATEQTLSDWLSPAQPEAVKRRVLDYVLDRALALVEPLARAARSDEVPGVRAMAVRCLATRSGRDATALAALMDVAGHDPRAECRAEAVQALRAFTDPSPQALATLVEALGTEKDVDLSRLLISVLLPYAATEGTVRQALMDVAASNPRAELAGPIVEALGELLRWGPELLPWFLAVYRGATSDQVKATALAALAGGAPGDERLYQIYAEATASPDPRIRSWGVLGLL